jgi:cyclic pyranopterin phosphate synthase
MSCSDLPQVPVEALARRGPTPAAAAGLAQRGSGGPLVDRLERVVTYLRVSLTDRCNYRCTYCMPDGSQRWGQRAEVLTLEEIVRLCREFVRWGVRRVRLSGGEPTIRRGLVDLVSQLAGLRTTEGAPLEVVLTTNGQLLAELARPLAEAGLAGLNVSLDSLDAARFRRVTRRGVLEDVLAGIEAARAAGILPIKLNTVAIRGFNDDEFGALCRYAWDRGLTPRFIEVMPMSGGELFVPGELLPAAELRALVADQLGGAVVPDDGRGVRGAGPATYWRLASGPRAGGRLGVIAPMTENFCGGCNRLRVASTGGLHACLAHDDSLDLRAALRSGDPAALEHTVRAVLRAKRDGHTFATDGGGGPRKAMVGIGG